MDRPSGDAALLDEREELPRRRRRPARARDYDGDGAADIAVFRPAQSLWLVRASSHARCGLERTWFARQDDVPVPADYDGDGRTDIAVFRPEMGRWLVHEARTPCFAGGGRFFGREGDVPVPSDLMEACPGLCHVDTELVLGCGRACDHLADCDEPCALPFEVAYDCDRGREWVEDCGELCALDEELAEELGLLCEWAAECELCALDYDQAENCDQGCEWIEECNALCEAPREGLQDCGLGCDYLESCDDLCDAEPEVAEACGELCAWLTACEGNVCEVGLEQARGCGASCAWVQEGCGSTCELSYAEAGVCVDRCAWASSCGVCPLADPDFLRECMDPLSMSPECVAVLCQRPLVHVCGSTLLSDAWATHCNLCSTELETILECCSDGERFGYAWIERCPSLFCEAKFASIEIVESNLCARWISDCQARGEFCRQVSFTVAVFYSGDEGGEIRLERCGIDGVEFAEARNAGPRTVRKWLELRDDACDVRFEELEPYGGPYASQWLAICDVCQVDHAVAAAYEQGGRWLREECGSPCIASFPEAEDAGVAEAWLDACELCAVDLRSAEQYDRACPWLEGCDDVCAAEHGGAEDCGLGEEWCGACCEDDCEECREEQRDERR